MMFWVLAAVLTAVVTIALLLPLSRRKGETVAADHDVEVYSAGAVAALSAHRASPC